MKLIVIAAYCLAILVSQNITPKNQIKMENQEINGLPKIGILVFEGFLANEVDAPLDVFTKANKEGKPLFNVFLVAEEITPYISEEGLIVVPDVNIVECLDLDLLVVPSSMTPDKETQNSALIRFIQKQHNKTDYTTGHCAGAFLLGEAGIADGKQIVTYCGGSQSLQLDYPSLLAQDDSVNSVVMDGKIMSSNGNLVSYLGSLDLLEKMAGKEQRTLVEEELLIHKLK
ncbi:DJ-1/PfpI family protein [Galbibacter sp.]|jgi:transcriptional regulator GlxA family with amidase domain|uniref:DJ-1/PfpI family protein n=1 Tax=Galbibacter sp. TaxID=2918471 RepID=UPI003A91680D